jgi:hypothetical protein
MTLGPNRRVDWYSPHTRICIKDTRKARHADEFSLVADGFEHETSTRKFNVFVGFEVDNGRDGEGRCGLGCGVFIVY